MFSASSIFTFIVVLGVIVVFHEFGHYIVARLCGVTVKTFSVGFGPKILKKQIGPTEYCLCALPLGGYVRMMGDDPNEEISEEDRAHAFLSQPVRKKIAIVVAGPLFNILLAIFIYSGIFMVGFPTLTAIVGEIQEGSAAEQGGLQSGDRIVAIEDKEIALWDEIRETVQKRDGKSLLFHVDRGGEKVTVTITPQMKESEDLFGEKHPTWLIGILPKGDQITKRYNPFQAVYLGVKQTWNMSVMNMVGIGKLIQGKISSDNLGGPIMIAQIVDQQASRGVLNIVSFIALLSINLGLINLFPIPVLDGGHLVFFTIEGILGRPLSLKKMEIAQQVGLFLIVSLMVFAMYNDIMRFFVSP